MARPIPAARATTAWFEWGTTTNYGNLAPTQSVGAGTSITNFSQTITGSAWRRDLQLPRRRLKQRRDRPFGTNQNLTTPLFTLVTNLTAVASGCAAWGDYDNDGRLDVWITGLPSGGNGVAEIWRNTGNGFSKYQRIIARTYNSFGGLGRL